jgi:hypothetical protein
VRPKRWLLIAVASFLLGVMLCGCTTAGDAEHAISERSHGRLTDPECEKFDDDMGEVTFACSADDGIGRIKLMVGYPAESNRAFVTEWPCVRETVRWKEIRRHPALQCARNLPPG